MPRRKSKVMMTLLYYFLPKIISLLTKYLFIVLTMYTYYCTNVFILPSIVLFLLMMLRFLKKYASAWFYASFMLLVWSFESICWLNWKHLVNIYCFFVLYFVISFHKMRLFIHCQIPYFNIAYKISLYCHKTSYI